MGRIMLATSASTDEEYGGNIEQEATSLRLEFAPDVTNNSSWAEVYGKELIIGIDFIFSAGESGGWKDAFTIKNIPSSLSSNGFCAVVNATGSSVRNAQAYQSGNDVIVRVRYPEADTYRGQIVTLLD